MNLYTAKAYANGSHVGSFFVAAHDKEQATAIALAWKTPLVEKVDRVQIRRSSDPRPVYGPETLA